MVPGRFLPLILAGLSAAACGGAPPAAAPAPAPDTVFVTNTVVRVDTVEVMDATAPPDTAAQRLRMRLLERDARIAQLERQLDDERTEVVSTMAKLESQASRAQAASAMAEAEIALQALAGTAGGPASAGHRLGVELLARSAQAFAAENYEGSIYLAGRARALGSAGHLSELESGRTPVRGEAPFDVPILLIVAQRSNLRDAPGSAGRIRTVLDEGTVVTGLFYTDEWIFVVVPAGEQGWIFHTLVRGRR